MVNKIDEGINLFFKRMYAQFILFLCGIVYSP